MLNILLRSYKGNIQTATLSFSFLYSSEWQDEPRESRKRNDFFFSCRENPRGLYDVRGRQKESVARRLCKIRETVISYSVIG